MNKVCVSPKVSIVVIHRLLDDELLDLSRGNRDRIEKFTHYPHEVIFVDNYSNEEYLDWLIHAPSRWAYLRNNYNAGNGKAWDQGVGIASSDIILLMDNDCWPLVPDWEKEMVDKLSDPQIGITFPNCIVGDALDRMESGLSVDFHPRRDGFCFAFRRETYDKVGPFLCDQPFKLGYYEDDWFEYRVQYGLGLKLVGCLSSKVWHKGQGTTKKMWSKEVEEGIEANKRWYEAKTKSQYPYLS